jgi:hypothetical protein
MAVDQAGNLYVAGSFGGALGFLGTGEDAGVVASCDAASGCTQTGYAMKIVPDGGLAWAQVGEKISYTATTFGGSAFNGIAVDGLGNATAVGWFYDTVVNVDAGTTTSVASNVVISSFDSTGAPRWTVTTGHGALGQDGIACDAFGDLFVAAWTWDNVTLPDGVDAGGTPDGGTELLAKLHSDGTTAWARTFPGAKVTSLAPMVNACGTDLVVTGNLSGPLTLDSVHDGGTFALGDAGILITRVAP